MTEVAPSNAVVVRPCPICGDPLTAKIVDSLITVGEDNAGVSGTLLALGAKYSVNAIQRHRETCRAGSLARTRYAAGAQSGKDFAVMVRDEAARLMEAGELKVSTIHGLRAQQMIDHREERQADRGLYLALGRMLAGSPPPPEIIVVTPGGEPGEGLLDPDDAEMIG